MARDYELAGQLLDLVLELSDGRTFSVQAVAERFGVKTAAARRYLTFAQMQVPAVKRRRGGRAVLQKPSEGESAFMRAVAIDLAAASAGWMEKTGLAPHLKEMRREVRAAIKASELDALERIVRSFHVKQRMRRPSTKTGQTLDRLLRAIRDNRVCELTYTKLGGAQLTYRVHPWSLNVVEGVLYLLAGKQPGDEERSFEIGDIGRLQVLDEQFPQPIGEDADSSRMLSESIGSYNNSFAEPVAVVLTVRGESLAWLRRRPLHASQSIDGSVDEQGWQTVRLNVVPCPELEATVLSLAPDVRILEPLALRDRVVARAAAAFGSLWAP